MDPDEFQSSDPTATNPKEVGASTRSESSTVTPEKTSHVLDLGLQSECGRGAGRDPEEATLLTVQRSCTENEQPDPTKSVPVSTLEPTLTGKNLPDSSTSKQSSISPSGSTLANNERTEKNSDVPAKNSDNSIHEKSHSLHCGHTEKPRRVALQTTPLPAHVGPRTASGEQRSASPSTREALSKESNKLTGSSTRDTMEEDQTEQGTQSSSVPQKRPRSPTPDDDEPDTSPSTSMSRPTIRLNVEVHPGGPSKSNYIVPIPQLSVERLESKYPKWSAWYRSTYLDSEASQSTYQSVGLSQQELEDLGDLAKLLQKYPTQGMGSFQRKRRADEYDVGSYDTKDPFVDDSELGLDEPTHIVKTRSDGFYVALGPVELARAKSHHMSSNSASAFRSSIGSLGMTPGLSGYARQTNKLLAKRAASRKGQGSAVSTRVHKDHPDQTDSQPAEGMPNERGKEASERVDVPEPERARETGPAPTSATNGHDKVEKKKNKYPVRPVHPHLQQMFDHLKVLVQRASFAVKTKFPPELKPPLIDTAKLAVELDEYNDNFFNYLPSIFPYNRFTMMKLTKREFFHKHMEYYRDLQNEHLDSLYKLIQESFPHQAADYAASETTSDGKATNATPNGNLPETSSEDRKEEKGLSKTEKKDGVEGDAPGALADDEEDDDENNDDEEKDDEKEDEQEVDLTEKEDGPGGGDDHTKRFRWSDDMREELFTIVTVENAMCEIRNEKLKLENSPETYSEINARKALYKRIADFVPEGWMTTTQVSREYGLIKKRRDREAIMELEIV